MWFERINELELVYFSTEKEVLTLSTATFTYFHQHTHNKLYNLRLTFKENTMCVFLTHVRR